MKNNFDSSRFGVKFWLGAAALLSVLALLHITIVTVQAISKHADFWVLSGFSGLLAVTIAWVACLGSYRRIRTSAVRSGASEDLLLDIQYWSAMTLAMMCAAINLLLVGLSPQ
jgi:hypothetical protein